QARALDPVVERSVDDLSVGPIPIKRRTLDAAARIADDPIPVGSPDQPFAPLPDEATPRVIVSQSGVALPVLANGPSGWLVSTACQAVQRVDGGTPVGRAHVVIDPGHGGVEPGAVGPAGTVEKDLNLTVAREAARLLTEAGATVVLTRDGDHTMTAAARGLVARSIAPALFVSIHHNAGAPPGPGGPGTIVFTQTGSAESTRFGGLFHQAITPILTQAADEATARHQAWVEEVERHEAARLAAPEGTEFPELPEGEPVEPFQWAGSGNAGVRSWVRADGEDHLALLRHSGPSPAALVEFLYVSNPSEEALLTSDGFLEAQAAALADAIVQFLGGQDGGTGFVDDQEGDQPIGGGGRIEDCVEPSLVDAG
ncbi:MAG: N-acetylmuramoyl-L-alanine amidase, partial [Actinomycetota bacterium]